MKLRRSRNVQATLLNYAFRLGAVQTAIAQGTIQPRTEPVPPPEPEPSTSEPLQKNPEYFKNLEKVLQKAFPDIYEQDSDDVSIPGSWSSECSHS